MPIWWQLPFCWRKYGWLDLVPVGFIWKSIKTTSDIAGISGRSQALFLVVFVARYLDLFTNFVSLYNSVMKVLFLASSIATVYLMFIKFKATYDKYVLHCLCVIRFVFKEPWCFPCRILAYPNFIARLADQPWVFLHGSRLPFTTRSLMSLLPDYVDL